MPPSLRGLFGRCGAFGGRQLLGPGFPALEPTATPKRYRRWVLRDLGFRLISFANSDIDDELCTLPRILRLPA